MRELKSVRPPRQVFRPSTRVPGTVRAAFWILLALAVAGVVNIIQVFVVNDWTSYQTAWLAVDPDAPVGFIVASFVVQRLFLMGVAGFFLWIAILVYRGVGWARVLNTIPAVLGIATIVGAGVYEIALVAANLGAAVLLWLPPSNAFFSAVKVERAKHRARPRM